MRSILAILMVASTVTAADESTYRPQRLDDGQPDLQGVWIASNAAPLERPAGYATRVITEAQAVQLVAAMEVRSEDRATPTEPTEYFETLRIEPVRGELRSSLIIDPADGLLPGNELFKRRIAQARVNVLSATDGPEQRPAPERCLGSSTAQPPILAIRSGVNLHQIVQTKDAFVFLSEFSHQARIIRLNSTHLRPELTSWLGDSIGRWESDTFVVETRSFAAADETRLAPFNNFLVSAQTIVTERFTRVSDDEINYVFTVEDPLYYTRPWTGESQFRRRNEQVLEYACHEGNYSLQHILEGARVRDGELE